MIDKKISWRVLPGFYRPGKSSFKSIQILLSEFLRDRHSPSLLQTHYSNDTSDSIKYGWGDSAPLEKMLHGLLRELPIVTQSFSLCGNQV